MKKGTRRAKPIYNGVKYDSDEEIEFKWWCDEAAAAGILSAHEYQSPTFLLSDTVRVAMAQTGKSGQKVKDKMTTLFRPATYTCDFMLQFWDKELQTRFGFRDFGADSVYVDVKPKHDPVSARVAVFRLNQKWVMQSHGVYVQPVIPIDLFLASWIPARAMLTKTGKLKTAAGYRDCKTLSQWLAGRNN